jgi:hypothetical protein
MTPASRTLHGTLLRAVKMMIAAWEKWVTES